MSIRKKIHLNGTFILFLGIIPVGKGKYDELNYSEFPGSLCLITGALR